MQKFELVIKNEKEKFYTVISFIIVISNIIFFFLMTASSGFKKSGPLVFAVLTIAAIVIPRYFKNKNEKPGFTGAFFVLALAWLNTKYWWVAFILVAFEVMDLIARRQLIVYVNEQRVSYPSFPKREIKWFDLSNILIKDRLLTIDFKNNKLIQHEIMNGENDYDINEDEFNDFCKQQLNKNELYKYN
jgi:hypothetical protein